jgi:hypothetical protein
MVKYQARSWKGVDHYEGVDANAPNIFGGGHRPMVQFWEGRLKTPWRSATEEVQGIGEAMIHRGCLLRKSC